LASNILDTLNVAGNARPRSVEFRATFQETASGKVRRT